MSAIFDAFILYDNLASGLRAKTLLNRAIYDVRPRVTPSLSVWRFDLMLDPWCRSMAVREAATAQVVILAAEGPGELPAEVQLWMSEWLDRRNERSCALVAAFEGRRVGSVHREQLSPVWRRAAADRGLGLFLHVFDPEAVEVG
jgi:hypothetical protein